MDTGLRRLWNRQRSKSRSVASVQNTLVFQPSPTYEVHTSGPAPQLGTLPFRPSQQRRTGSDVIYNKLYDVAQYPSDRGRGEQRDDQHTNGIKPILVGVSRPTTAGSLAQAVNDAADHIDDYRPQAVQYQHHPAAHRPRAVDKPEAAPKARYIDIFQVTAASKGQSVNFNEDIARRNLDLQALARGGDVRGYTSSSRYGEDVAVRNASIEFLRDSIERGRDQSPIVSRNTRLPNESGSGNFRSAKGSNRSRKKPESSTRDFPRESIDGLDRGRDISAKKRNPRQQDRDTIADHEGEYPPKHIQKETTARSTHNQRSTETQQVRNDAIDTAPAATRATANAVQPPLHLQTAPKANVGRPMLNGGKRGISSNSVASQHSVNSLPGYRITAQEGAWDQYHNDHSRSRNVSVRTLSTHKTRPELVSAQSAVGKASLRKAVNLSNRTIMDLTGDDSEVFADTDAISSYIESPVVRQAQFRSMHAAQPSLVQPPPDRPMPSKPVSEDVPNFHEGTEYIDLAEIDTPLRARMVETEIRKQNYRAEDLDDGQITPRATEPQMTFSGVNTIASFSPRSSVLASPPAAPRQSDTFRPQEMSMGQSIPAPVVPLSISVISPEGDSIREAADSPTIPMHPVPRNNAAKSKPAQQMNLTNIQNGSRNGVQQSRQVNKAPVRASPFASPESLNSTDFRRVGELGRNGILARDFASIASSTDPSDESATDDRGRTPKPIMRRARTDVLSGDDDSSSTYSPPRYVDNRPRRADDAEFDEAGFSRKQVEAKAALLRLQQSLNEDFSTPKTVKARPAPVKSHSQPSHTPTSKFKRPSVPPIFEAPLLENKSDPVVVSHTTPQQHESGLMTNGVATTTSNPTETPVPEPTLELSDQNNNQPALEQRPSFYSMVTSPASTPLGSPKPSRSVNGDHHAMRSLASIPEQSLDALRADLEPPQKGSASPGEISLSSFPFPNSTPQHSRTASLSQVEPIRRNSLKSISSTASAFSIPYHLVPGRGSSMRDHLDTFSLDD